MTTTIPGISMVEKICYTLGHMDSFENRPPELKEKFFELLFNLMEIANFAPDERVKYEHDMTTERDRLNQLDYARKVFLEKGREEGLFTVARNLLNMGMPLADIAKATGLSESQIQTLK